MLVNCIPGVFRSSHLSSRCSPAASSQLLFSTIIIGILLGFQASLQQHLYQHIPGVLVFLVASVGGVVHRTLLLAVEDGNA